MPLSPAALKVLRSRTTEGGDDAAGHRLSRLDSTSSVGSTKAGGSEASSSGQQEAAAAEPSSSSSAHEHQQRIVTALYDYKGRTSECLTFKAGDRLRVVEETNEDWWRAEKLKAPRKVGYIPAAYVATNPLQERPWFHGKISRAESEKLLLGKGGKAGRAGTFLVRESERNVGEYTLSVTDGVRARHYRIPQEAGTARFFIISTVLFASIDDLIEHYSKDADGLCTQLTRPCVRQQQPPTIQNLSHSTVDHWEIPRESIKFVKKLGAGQFGEVWEGIWMNVTPVAVKTLKPGTMAPEEFLSEAGVMKPLKHDRLVALYAVCTVNEPILIVTELMRNGSLLEYLRKDGGKKLGQAILIDMGAQVATGMRYLESRGFLHRDLAARNCLVGDNNIVKVADFGLTRAMETKEYYKTMRKNLQVPIRWTAPEVISDARFSTKSDVWAFGVLLYEIITYGQTPYPGMKNSEVLNKVEEGYRMPKPDTCPDKLYALMLDCWKKRAEDRPTFESIQWRLEDYHVQTDTEYASVKRGE